MTKEFETILKNFQTELKQNDKKVQNETYLNSIYFYCSNRSFRWFKRTIIKVLEFKYLVT